MRTYPSRLGVLFAALVSIAALVAVMLPSTPAAAARPLPNINSYGRSIDPLARYDPQTRCSPSAKPGALAFRALIKRTYGSQTTYIGRRCGSGTSEHYEGRAIDWMLNSRYRGQRIRGDNFIKWLKRTDQYGNKYAMVRRLGVMYIIWKGRMWRAYDPERGSNPYGWTEYLNCRSSMTSRSYDNTCHRNHIHVSLSWRGANAQTSYYR